MFLTKSAKEISESIQYLTGRLEEQKKGLEEKTGYSKIYSNGEVIAYLPTQ